MNVQYFRPQRPGPEAAIESAVVGFLPEIYRDTPDYVWAAGSVRVGAGMPDLLVALCEPQVIALANLEIPAADVLAYLRAVRCALPETIASRTGHSQGLVLRTLKVLEDATAVCSDSSAYHLHPLWKEVLPEIITIEVKVSDWRKAIMQASRNSIFAHRSYIAVPDRVATRIRCEESLRRLGLGLLSISDGGTVSIVRRALKHRPRVWTYYYQLASLAALHIKEERNAVHRADESSGSGLSGIHIPCCSDSK